MRGCVFFQLQLEFIESLYTLVDRMPGNDAFREHVLRKPHRGTNVEHRLITAIGGHIRDSQANGICPNIDGSDSWHEKAVNISPKRTFNCYEIIKALLQTNFKRQ